MGQCTAQISVWPHCCAILWPLLRDPVRGTEAKVLHCRLAWRICVAMHWEEGKNNNARSQFHMLASNPEISHITLPVQPLLHPCSCVCWGTMHSTLLPPLSRAPHSFCLLTHNLSAHFNLFALLSQFGTPPFAWVLSDHHCIEKTVMQQRNSRMNNWKVTIQSQSKIISNYVSK